MYKIILATLAVAVLGFVSVAQADANKVVVCHVTSSEKTPVVYISISDEAVQAHLDHGDVLAGADGDCSGVDPVPE
jgi:hypothetical protein